MANHLITPGRLIAAMRALWRAELRADGKFLNPVPAAAAPLAVRP